MSRKWYGSLNNRLEENKMYCKNIEEGTLLTEYMYSDCHPYEVVKVIDQKHVLVRSLDHKKKENSEAFDNNWELISNPNNPTKELKFRYGKWNWVSKATKETIKRTLFIDKKLYDKVMKDGEATVYHQTNISFGKAEYYYDYTI